MCPNWPTLFPKTYSSFNFCDHTHSCFVLFCFVLFCFALLCFALLCFFLPTCGCTCSVFCAGFSSSLWSQNLQIGFLFCSLYNLSLDNSHYLLIKHHVYADDSQVYLSRLDTSCEIQSCSPVCLCDVSAEILPKHLTLNMPMNLELLENPLYPKPTTS